MISYDSLVLTLAVALLYVWLISVGGNTIHQGLRHLVDRNDRRDLSIFQIGLRYIKRRLTNAFSVSYSALFLPMTSNCQVAFFYFFSWQYIFSLFYFFAFLAPWRLNFFLGGKFLALFFL